MCLDKYGDQFSLLFDVDLEPFGLFDVDNCGVEEVTDVAGVISKQGMLDDEVCVYEIVRQKGENSSGLCNTTFYLTFIDDFYKNYKTITLMLIGRWHI